MASSSRAAFQNANKSVKQCKQSISPYLNGQEQLLAILSLLKVLADLSAELVLRQLEVVLNKNPDKKKTLSKTKKQRKKKKQTTKQNKTKNGNLSASILLHQGAKSILVNVEQREFL